MWVLLLLLALAGFGGLSLLVQRDSIREFDLSIIHTVQGWENDYFTRIAKTLSFIGSSSVTIPLALSIAVVLAIVLKHRREIILFVGTLLGSWLLNATLKSLYQRARPDIHRIVTEAGFSFPSGHSMSAFSLYGILTYLLWRHLPSRGWRIALILFSLCMVLGIGLSRIYLGVHYPSDVIGGYWVSACWVTLCIRLFMIWQKRTAARRNGSSSDA
ncbi:phosphatase PAP2 family protein [Paenibacillus nasutitermitis]|uniref:Phosphatidylglycerophosphatase B n=1 Tax=Paenibacillus nasutitermitis TaxID=1652958 RepID=A0A916Z8I8_9BACL|nr:phosphatase PAP2 family protein [Paenibacillus nasutitermitis]GGD81314.1 phosphatidylglycerophosphatase B [Paenibacillus nasutitermitis]